MMEAWAKPKGLVDKGARGRNTYPTDNPEWL